MKYTVLVGGVTRTVDIEGESVRLDGAPVAIAVHQAGTPVRRLVVGTQSIEVVIVPGDDPGTWVVAADGSRLAAQVLDERSRTIRERVHQHVGHHGPLNVQAPMPGLVVRVLVQPGDPVKAGTGLVVIEAMKMENELKAPAEGTVAKVLVSAGERVEKGAALVRLNAGDQGPLTAGVWPG